MLLNSLTITFRVICPAQCQANREERRLGIRHPFLREGPGLPKRIHGNHSKSHTANFQHTWDALMLMSVAAMDIEEEQILYMMGTRYKTIEEFILKLPLQGIKCDIKGGPS